MLSHLKPIQIEMLKLFKSRIINNSHVALISKSELSSNFNDIPISSVFFYIEELTLQNIIRIDWKPYSFNNGVIKVQFHHKTLEYFERKPT